MIVGGNQFSIIQEAKTLGELFSTEMMNFEQWCKLKINSCCKMGPPNIHGKITPG